MNEVSKIYISIWKVSEVYSNDEVGKIYPQNEVSKVY